MNSWLSLKNTIWAMTETKQYIALLDANVLYPAPVRDIFLQLAKDRHYQARWTDRLQEEWINALLRNEPDRDRAVLERTRDIMNREFPEATIYGFEHRIIEIQLPDEDDRHVLAAAIHNGCDIIVTENIKDFPLEKLEPLNIRAVHPDRLLVTLLKNDLDGFCRSVRQLKLRLKNPPYSIKSYLDNLERRQLVATSSELRRLTHLLD